ncbi:MAG TPA: hypothetical protein RWO66_07135 [Ruminococcus sp.]
MAWIIFPSQDEKFTKYSKIILTNLIYYDIMIESRHLAKIKYIKGEVSAAGRPFEHILSMKQKSSPFLRSDTVFGF